MTTVLEEIKQDTDNPYQEIHLACTVCPVTVALCGTKLRGIRMPYASVTCPVCEDLEKVNAVCSRCKIRFWH